MSAPTTPVENATSPTTLSPELLNALASNPAAAAVIAAALSPTGSAPTFPPTAPSSTATATSTTLKPPSRPAQSPPTRALPSFSSGPDPQAMEPSSRQHRFDEENTTNWADDDVEMPSFPSRSEPSILQKVAQAIDAKSKAMLPGQEVEKHGYDLLVLHNKQNMADMKAAEGAAEQVTIRDCMPNRQQRGPAQHGRINPGYNLQE